MRAWLLTVALTGCGPTPTTSEPDLDGDGLVASDDCDDTDRQAYFLDADEDGYGSPDDIVLACAPPTGHVDNPLDCDDDASSTHPGAEELLDEQDNDCDDEIDEPWPTVRFTPPTAEGLMAKACGGDPEFNGNGPDVDITVTLTHTGDQVDARVEGTWTETVPDYTSGCLSASLGVVYAAPADCSLLSITDAEGTVAEVLSETASYTDVDPDPDVLTGDAVIDRLVVQSDAYGKDVGAGTGILKLVFQPVEASLHCP
ncbi:MAG: putative metal-binding motif-containing protein [Myxococcales bacterium]|nr:putative metal-binding motif-containing protein [Myxococcales bacterium]